MVGWTQLNPIKERDKSQKWRNPPKMHKEMIHIFFHLKTHRAPTWTTKTSFKHASVGIVWNGLAEISISSRIKKCENQKLLTVKDPLELCGKQSHHCHKANSPPQQAKATNCRCYPLPNRWFQCLMSPFHETPSWTITSFKWAILKGLETEPLEVDLPHQTSCQNNTLEPSFTWKWQRIWRALQLLR